jgi:hypothetical protein
MKVAITISGQIGGNNRLYRALDISKSIDITNMPYYGYRITYPSKTFAKRAIQQAFQYLRAQEPEFKGGIQYGYKKESLTYDASQAVISIANEEA